MKFKFLYIQKKEFKMKKIILVILSLFFLNNAVFANENEADKILKEKIAQMLIVGFNEQSLVSNNPIYSDIKDLKIGGVILYSKSLDKTKTKLIKNIKDFNQLKRLTSELQKIYEVPLFIGVEQEGGYVSPLSPSYFVISMFTNDFLGKKNDINFSKKEFEKTAKTLSEAGINLNFAPVVDLNINKNSKLIGAQRRSFSDNPDIVTAHARELISAHKKYGVLTTLKHYPGLGTTDSTKLYKGFYDITNSYNEIEMKPFEKLSKEAEGIILGHAYNKNIDENYPLSLSEKSIQENLINKLNYEGLIFIDDIQNSAIMSNYTLENTVKQALLAGVDVIIIGNNLNYQEDIAKNTVEIIFDLVKNGVISESRIEKSYNKILEIKKSLKIESIN